MYGGEPEQIQQTITEGRHGVMPPWRDTVTAAEAADIAHYVRSLSGLAHDSLKAVRGRKGFEQTCVACHGAEGKGNTALGAPDLTANTWLYGSSEATIVETILNGRENQMPAQKGILTEDQIRLLTAWVWGLSNRDYALFLCGKGVAWLRFLPINQLTNLRHQRQRGARHRYPDIRGACHPRWI